MENQFQKAVTLSYLALSIIIYFIVVTSLMKLSSLLDWESKVHSIEYIIRFGSIALGALIFLVLFKHPQTNVYMNDVASELFTKVTWPSSKETISATIVVVITVLIAGFILGLLDQFWAYAIRSIL